MVEVGGIDRAAAELAMMGDVGARVWLRDGVTAACDWLLLYSSFSKAARPHCLSQQHMHTAQQTHLTTSKRQIQSRKMAEEQQHHALAKRIRCVSVHPCLSPCDVCVLSPRTTLSYARVAIPTLAGAPWTRRLSTWADSASSRCVCVPGCRPRSSLPSHHVPRRPHAPTPTTHPVPAGIPTPI